MERNEARRIANTRLIRTVILGAIATAAGFYWLGQQYGIEPDVMRGYILTTLLFVGLLAALGLLGAGLLLLIKRFNRGREKSDRL
ncbi:MAG: hypothetical protein GKR90_01915 [Pseudomonadales bacterium]|nr:hypothetical protein [Pseudomonadales bacterium]